LKNQGEDIIKRAIKHIELEISAAATAAYIEEESGFGCDPKAVAAFRRKLQFKSYRINMGVVARLSGGTNATFDPSYNPTAADRLLADLEADPTYSY
jgi:hypothetical protein